MDDIDVIRSFPWLNACHWSSTTCGQAIRRAAGAAYHSLKKNTWSDLEIGVDCTDTFSTWHFPPNGEPQKLDGVFSNSTIKDICFGKNWMTFFRKKNTWYITGRPLGQAGHGGHVGIAR